MADLALVLVVVVGLAVITVAGRRRSRRPQRSMAGVAAVNEALARASDAARHSSP